jgi:KDO II ethanolaminephosphotransferase
MLFIAVSSALLFFINLISASNVADFLQIGSPMIFFILAVFCLFSFHSRALKTVFCILWVLASVLCFYKLFYGIYFGVEIALSFFDVKSQTHLIWELVSLKLALWILTVTLIPCVVACFWKIKPVRKYMKFGLGGFVVFSLIGSGILALRTSNLQEENLGVIRMGETSLSLFSFSPFDFFYSIGSSARIIRHNNKIKVISLTENHDFTWGDLPKNLKIIFVLGETARSDRFQINGYNRETSPNLMKLKDGDGFFNLQDATACRTYTRGSVECLFSRHTRESYNNKLEETSFTEVLKKMGFKISVFSLQNLGGFYRYLGADKMLSKYDILTSQKSLLDGNVLPLLEKFANNDGKDFILLHTLGSHYHYAQRYPKEFEKFTPTCGERFKSCTSEELNNGYDNTILYTDYVLNEVIEIARGKMAIVIYISDHGESLGENGVFLHGGDISKAPREQLEIPFFIYLSPSFAGTKLGKNVSLKLKNYKSGASHDNIFHSILGCLGVKNADNSAKLIDEKLNLCN